MVYYAYDHEVTMIVTPTMEAEQHFADTTEQILIALTPVITTLTTSIVLEAILRQLPEGR
jgi:hypothetical protein